MFSIHFNTERMKQILKSSMFQELRENIPKISIAKCFHIQKKSSALHPKFTDTLDLDHNFHILKPEQIKMIVTWLEWHYFSLYYLIILILLLSC